jgi:hypothetical protein
MALITSAKRQSQPLSSSLKSEFETMLHLTLAAGLLLISLLSAGTLGIASASVDGATTMAGLTDSRVTYTGSRIAIDWNGLNYGNGTLVKVDFNFIPEPRAMTLIGLGLAAMRRQCRAKAKGVRGQGIRGQCGFAMSRSLVGANPTWIVASHEPSIEPCGVNGNGRVDCVVRPSWPDRIRAGSPDYARRAID